MPWYRPHEALMLQQHASALLHLFVLMFCLLYRATCTGAPPHVGHDLSRALALMQLVHTDCDCLDGVQHAG